MGNPVVELFNESIFLNTQVALIDLFNFTDPDGDALDFVLVDDFQSDGTGGQFLVNGTPADNGGRIRVEAEDLANVFYLAGSRIAWEGYRVIAYDVNGEHSEFNNSGRLYTVRENVTRPNVQDIATQMFLFGTQIDYETSLLESGFKFNNPNVSEACGCGESIKFDEALFEKK